MKKSEIIELNREKIADLMREDYRAVLNSMGRTQAKIYIWEDGELEELYDAQGSTARLKPKDWEDRVLYYVTTVSYPFFDPWDFTYDSIPDDEDEREKAEEEIIEWLCGEYDHEVESIIDELIDEAKQEED